MTLLSETDIANRSIADGIRCMIKRIHSGANAENAPVASLAFLVQAHEDPVQVRRLVDRLKPHDVYIHLDAKTPLDESWRSIPATFVEPRAAVYWAGYSQVEATTYMVRAALATGKPYCKLVLLSGSCYPIRHLSQLEELFASDGGKNYIQYVDMRQAPHLLALISRRYHQDGLLPSRWISRWRFLALWDKILRKAYTKTAGLFKDRWTLPFTPCHGSQWWALTPDAAAECLHVLQCNSAIRNKYRRSFAPDEQVFHTIIESTRFAASATGMIPFNGRGVYKTANLHVIDPSLTRWFTLDDFDEIMSTDKFFVRKVRSDLSAPLLDAIDQALAAQAIETGS